MNNLVYEDISFDNFCNIFKIYFKWTYAELARSLNCNERTLQRWRKSNKYHSLHSSKYITLFRLLESKCKTINVDSARLLIEYFRLPKSFLNEDYEKIKSLIIYNLDLKLDASHSIIKPSASYSFNLSSIEFITNCIHKQKQIKSICMAFHSGWDWLKLIEKRKTIDLIDHMGIQLYVLVNHKDAIQKIAESMENKEVKKYYIGYNQGIRQWHICENALENLELRISNYPLMRRCYIVNYTDNSFEVIHQDYVYDHAFSSDGNNYRHYTNLDNNGSMFVNEFKFLWNHAYTYQQWRTITPLEDEVKLEPGSYVLLYKKNNCDDKQLNQRFVISKLSIMKDNKVSLEVNISSELTYPLIKNTIEYLYTGKAKITKNNIYITLYDSYNTEQVTISLVRPLHECNRYIGIMNALTQAAHPVAYKCVCFEEEKISNINLEVILDLLQHQNRAWDNHLMIIEENDSSSFYSNAIFNNLIPK